MIFRNWYYLSANLTEAELALEPAIARLGERYRSQWLFPRFCHIADFVLLDRKVIIEVDGSSHDTPEQRRKDIVHTLQLASLGYKVIRVSNKEAIENPSGVIESLDARVANRPTVEALKAALAALPEPPPKKPRRRKQPPAKKAQRKSGTPRGRTPLVA